MDLTQLVERHRSWWSRRRLAVFLAGAAILCRAAVWAGQPPAQTYYLPLAEDILYAHYAGMGQTTASNIVYIVSISVAVSNTVIYYDPCADGYEKDISNPTQSTTQVWGDGNPSNGMPPGYTNDVLNAGSVIVLQTTNVYPRIASTSGYHAGDQLASTKPVSITVVAWPTSTGPLLGEGCEVYDTGIYGNTFVAPVGTNVIDSVQYPMFDSSMLEIMAAQDGTVVKVDLDGSGAYEITNMLNRGQEFFMTNVVAGARVSASLPVEVQLLTAQKNSNYANRWYTLYPKEVWSSDYYTPVNTTSSTYPAACYLYNDQSTPLAVTCVTASGSTVTNVPANRCVRYDMPAANTGARFYTSNGVPFEAVMAVCESFADPNHGSTYDWGATLLPAPLLSTVSLVGYGAGSDDGTANGSPVWAMALSNTTLYVDYYATSTTSGAKTDPYGNHYDTNVVVTAFQPMRLFNPTGNSQTGMRVYTLDGTKIVCMWGEDPATAGTASPFIDAGTSIFPIPTFSVVKASQLIYDANTNGAYDAGDRIRYTIYMSNAGMRPLTNLWLNDPLPANITYYPGSTLLDGVAIADETVPPQATAYPLDEGGRYIGTIPPGASRVVSFDVAIANPLPSGVTNILNIATASVQGYQATVTNNVDLGASTTVSGWILADQNANGVADAADTNGIGGVTVRLLNSSSNVVATTTTTANGAYIFTNIMPGAYTVVQTLPAGYTNTLDASVPNDLRIPITLAFAHASTANNFYDAAFAALGDFTWLDTNRNGIQDTGEPGLAGVVVTLYNTNNAIVATTTSSLAGAYAFTGILPGAYTVGFTPPGGYLFTTSNVGNDVTDSDPLPGTNRTAAIALASGQTDNDVDAGFYLGAYVPARLGDLTWIDANGNGVQDAGETGLVGVVVQLYDLTNALVAATTSTAAGAYAFTNVAPGTYTLAFTLPAGYLFTTSNVGLDATDSDPLPGTNRTAAVTIGSAQTNNNIDAGFYPAARIAGAVLLDVNGNGVADAGDTNGIAGVQVRLLDASSNVVGTAMTPAAGAYGFTNLTPGAYTVVQTLPSGYTNTLDSAAPNDLRIPLTLAIGQASTGNNFYDAQYTAISGAVRVDVNGNGVVDPADTNGIASVTVQLLGAGSNVVATTTTASDGSYSFANVMPGVYTVRETDLSGWYSTLDVSGANDNLVGPLTLTSGQSSTGNNFYDTAYAAIGDFTWVDSNVNGVQDGESGLAGVVVRLYNTNDTVIATTTSSVAGAYVFTSVPAGTYTVAFTPPAGYLFTTSNVGTDATDSDPLPGTNRTAAITLTSGLTNNNVDAGFYQLASIAGAVLLDVNGNGVADAGDTNGIAGVTVTLLNAASNIVATAITSATGAHTFTNLTPGAYTVVQTLPFGYTNTLDTAAPNDLRIPLTLASGQASTGNFFYDTPSGSVAAQNKVLYLNDPSQSLNRIDPVATGDNATANTALFGTLLWDSTTSTDGSGTSFTFSHTTGTGTNRLLLVGVSMQQGGQSVSGVTYGGISLTQVSFRSNGTGGTSTRMEIWQLVNPPVGVTNVVVTLSATSQAAIGAATFSGVDQTTPFGTFVSATGNSATPSVIATSAAGELVFDTMSSRNGATATQGAGQTLLWQDTAQANVTGGGSTEPGAASVTMSWTAGNNVWAIGAVPIKPASAMIKQAVFTQAPAFALPFVLASNATIQITNYVNVVGGTMPASPAIIATLSAGGTPFLSLSSPTYNSGSGTLVWSGTLPNSVNVGAGQAILLTVSNAQTNVQFSIRYDSATYPSKIILPTASVIQVPSLGVYDAPYPGGSPVASSFATTQCYVRVTVTDPFGAYDIADVDLAIDGPGTAGDKVASLTDANVVSSNAWSKTYEYPWQTTNVIGNYAINVTANEGTEGITASATNTESLYSTSIGDFCWIDANANGQQDIGETDLVGVVVLLYNTNNVVVATATSSVTGAYAFIGILPGTYTVGFTPPAGYLFTTSGVGNAAMDSNPLPGTNRTAAVTVASGQTDNTIDAGFYRVANLAGAVLIDVNGNGVADTGDTNGIAGVTVRLFDAASNVVGTAMTTAAGAYSFTNLTPGAYTVVQTLPAGYTNTLDTAPPNDLRIPLTLTSGQTPTGNNFYDTQYASISGAVRVDLNGNGVVDAGDTNGIAGVTVQLLDVGSIVVATTTTGADGSYSFANVRPGAYTVRETDLPGWYSTLDTTSPNDNLIPVSLTSGQASTGNNFYDTAYASVSGAVLVDVNGNGIAEAGDTNGISGVFVRLLDASSNVVATTTTSATGAYGFTSLPVGNYTVVQTVPAGYTNTLDTAAPNDLRIPLSLSGSQASTNNTFYDTAFVAIGDFTWVDTNGNGVQDGGEPGLSNVVVRLYDTNNAVIATTTSSVALPLPTSITTEPPSASLPSGLPVSSSLSTG